ncbi:carbohydrate ABC transporter permease [Georgenia alba]|uniref:Carbohydrate ABC transporter permease n=1 Tax=Georgenia alba TaxID=2233858 RepID=A0ABW2Q9R6_9MICO
MTTTTEPREPVAKGGTVTAPPQNPSRRPDAVRGWLYMAPFAIAFVLFLIWPTVYGLWMSFTGRSLTGANADPIGFANYSEAFADPQVWSSLWNTIWFTILSTVPLVILPLLFAVLVNSGVRGQWLWRLSIFMPYLLASTVISQIWIWLYNPELGLVNEVLRWFGVGSIAWLQDPNTAMLAIVIATVWWTIGFNFLLYLSALQAIPDQLYEAAALDGAGTFRQFWSITVPQLGPTTVLVVILQILASLKVFDQIYQMAGGGPGGATRPILQYVYEVGFTGYRLGYASAISYLFFFLIILVSIVYMVINSRRGVRS